MQFKTKFFIILLFLLFLNILTVSATEDNSTDFNPLNENNTIQIENNISNTNQSIQKTTPNITIQTNTLKSKDTLEIYLKNSTNGSLESKNLTINLNNKNYTYTTNSKGIVKFPINLAKGTYTLTVSFKGDDEYNATFAAFKIILSKLNTRIIE